MQVYPSFDDAFLVEHTRPTPAAGMELKIMDLTVEAGSGQQQVSEPSEVAVVASQVKDLVEGLNPQKLTSTEPTVDNSLKCLRKVSDAPCRQLTSSCPKEK